MREKTKKGVFYLIFLLVILLIIRYIVVHWSDFEQVRLVNPGFLITLIVLTICFSLSYGLVIKYILKPFGIHLVFKEWFGLSIITSFYNIIAPVTGGVVPRALYLKKKYNFSYSHFISSLSGVYITHFFIGSLLGLSSLFFIYVHRRVFNVLMFSIFLSLFLFTLIVILFSPRLQEPKNKLIHGLVAIVNGWHTIVKDKRVVTMACLITIIQTIINLAGIAIAFEIFNIKIPLYIAFFLACTGFIGGFLSVSPGIIGVSEVIAIFASSLIGVTLVQALSVALLTRVVSTIVILVLGPIFSGILLNHANGQQQSLKAHPK